MSTIKQDRKDLEMLLNGVAPIADTLVQQPAPQPIPQTSTPQKPATVIDNTQGTNLEGERIFEFDYDALKKGLRKKAKKTIQNITKHILTDDLLEEEYVKDKIEQDVETLADLYMQVETNNVMQRSILDTVSRGNTMPRMYEVFGQLTDKIQAINKQILATENQIRKTYIDLKFEIKDKNAEMLNQHGNTNALPNNINKNMITSSTQLIDMAKKKHLEKLKEAKETEYIEE